MQCIRDQGIVYTVTVHTVLDPYQPKQICHNIPTKIQPNTQGIEVYLI